MGDGLVHVHSNLIDTVDKFTVKSTEQIFLHHMFLRTKVRNAHKLQGQVLIIAADVQDFGEAVPLVDTEFIKQGWICHCVIVTRLLSLNYVICQFVSLSPVAGVVWGREYHHPSCKPERTPSEDLGSFWLSTQPVAAREDNPCNQPAWRDSRGSEVKLAAKETLDHISACELSVVRLGLNKETSDVFTSDFLLFMYSVASSLSTSSTPTAGKEDSCSSSLTVLLMSSMIIWASLCTQIVFNLEYCSKCFHVGFHHTEREISYLPVFPGDSYHVWFLSGQKPLEVFNVMGLKMTHTNVL